MKKRQRNKNIKNSMVIYDTCSKPNGLSFKQLVIGIQNGLVFYDSMAGNKPEIYPKRNTSSFKFKKL